MIKPLGVLLVLGIVSALVPCLLLALWGMVRSVRVRKRETAVLLGVVALGIVVFSAWAVHYVAPKGDRTIAQLSLSDGRAFVVRHYRHGWMEYSRVRFYSRDTDGTWTSFEVISELIDPNSTTLVLDESALHVVLPGAGSYSIPDNEFVNGDGSRGNKRHLPSGIEPGEEE